MVTWLWHEWQAMFVKLQGRRALGLFSFVDAEVGCLAIFHGRCKSEYTESVVFEAA